jgi:hypothetical protein
MDEMRGEVTLTRTLLCQEHQCNATQDQACGHLVPPNKWSVNGYVIQCVAEKIAGNVIQLSRQNSET